MKTKLRDRFGRFTRGTARKVAGRMGVMFGVYGLLILGGLIGQTGGTVVVNQVEAETKVATTTEAIPPMLLKIEKCESKTGQYKDGQVTINATQDLGLAQINLPTWAKTATKMGLDLSKPEDNQKFAVWLFNNYGDIPWVSSKGCWSK